jgi:hypothetical protein
VSVVSVDEIWSGRGGDVTTTQSGKSVVRRTRMFRVVTDTRADDEGDVLTHADVPKDGDQHPDEPLATVRHRSAQNEPFSALVWIVTIGYSTEYEVTENPLNQPAYIEWNTEQFQTIAVKDRYGRAIVNSAGDPFDPPPEKDDSRWTVSVRKNVPGVPSWILAYRDAVNSDPFVVDGVGIAAGAAKIQRIRIGGWEHRNSTAYRVFSFSMHIRESWRLLLLDQGFRVKNPDANAQRVQATNDGDEEFPTSPIPLDGSGNALSNPTLTTAVFYPAGGWEIYDPLPFAALPGLG